MDALIDLWLRLPPEWCGILTHQQSPRPANASRVVARTMMTKLDLSVATERSTLRNVLWEGLRRK